MKKNNTQYQDIIPKLYPELFPFEKVNGKKVMAKTVTFQVTDACNLRCSYCYQINKGSRKMSFETAKKFIDLLISGEKGMKDYVGIENSPAIVLEFIGGEPFLEIDLISQICEYFETKCAEEMHPWATRHMFSICSNGTLYRDEKVQAFLYKYSNRLSFSITIDGNKELHDSCRVFPDGSPSYDLAYSAAQDWMKKGFYMGSKITIAPGNLPYLEAAIKNMIDSGYDEINANCVYEEGWNAEYAKDFYQRLKNISDYFDENNLKEKVFLSLFSETGIGDLIPPSENSNWCGGTGMMLACDPDGKFFPCIRYMESSLGTDKPPLTIGDVDNGIGQRQCEKDCLKCLDSITRRSQSTDECFNCPIGSGCSWCSGYNYQIFGTPNKRATYICIMHKARVLANTYFWNQYYIKNNIPKRLKVNCPKEWALEIISEEEYNFLIELSKK